MYVLNINSACTVAVLFLLELSYIVVSRNCNMAWCMQLSPRPSEPRVFVKREMVQSNVLQQYRTIYAYVSKSASAVGSDKMSWLRIPLY